VAPRCHQALALDIAPQKAGEQACGVGGVDQQLFAGKIARAGGTEALRCPRAIRAVRERTDIAVLGDAERTVLAVIAEGPGLQRPGPVHVIAQRIAIGIVTHAHATNAGRRMWPDTASPLHRIDHVRIGRTQGRVKDHVIGIIIGKVAVIDRAIEIIGADQPVEPVITISP
jgi:hypothetical protein